MGANENSYWRWLADGNPGDSSPLREGEVRILHSLFSGTWTAEDVRLAGEREVAGARREARRTMWRAIAFPVCVAIFLKPALELVVALVSDFTR